MTSSSFFLITITCLTVAYANPLNRYLLNMMTRGMDPMTKSLMQSTIGADLLDMDMGSSQSSNGFGSYGSFSPMGYGSNNFFGSSMSNYPWQLLPSPSFTTTNLVQPSAIKPRNPYDGLVGGNRQLITSQSAAIGGMSGASAGGGATSGSGSSGGGSSAGGSGGFPGGPFMPPFYPMGYSFWRNLFMMNMMGFDMF